MSRPTIQCNQCTTQFQCDSQDNSLFTDMPELFRFEAREQGWQTDETTLCPSCIKKNLDFWRLPTEREMLSLLWSNPLTDPARFEGRDDIDVDDLECDTDFVDIAGQRSLVAALPDIDRISWTTRERKPTKSAAFVLRFDLGRTVAVSKRGNVSIRLVRSGQASRTWKFGDNIEDRYSISECKTYVTDNRTGLQWQRYLETEKMGWSEAMKAHPQQRG